LSAEINAVPRTAGERLAVAIGKINPLTKYPLTKYCEPGVLARNGRRQLFSGEN